MKKIIAIIGIIMILLFVGNHYIIETTDAEYDIKSNLAIQVTAEIDQYIPYGEIPKDLIEAIVSVEDNRFFSHSGFDIIGFGRALLTNIKEGSFEQGGSTITQQLAKNLFLTQEKTIIRKVKELFLAWEVERNYSKGEIMELYLNNNYFGAGAYGIQEASQSFFHKDVNQLSREECAMLAGVLKGPSIYNPIEHIEQAKERQEMVLRLMEENE